MVLMELMCGHCEAHVNDAVRNALKVKKVSSSHAKKETVIIAEEGLTDEPRLSQQLMQQVTL